MQVRTVSAEVEFIVCEILALGIDLALRLPKLRSILIDDSLIRMQLRPVAAHSAGIPGGFVLSELLELLIAGLLCSSELTGIGVARSAIRSQRLAVRLDVALVGGDILSFSFEILSLDVVVQVRPITP